MKCDACGAPVENGKCTYCGKEFPQEAGGNVQVNLFVSEGQQQKKPLSHRTWFVILWLVIFFPVGLYLMWKNTEWNKIVKIIITVFFVLDVIGAIVAG